jgi:hypothetical protein
VTGRQLARVSATDYRETVWSEVYPGNQHTVQCFKPGGLAAETALELAPAQRKRTVWRLDGGAGSDDHVRWLLKRGLQVVAKEMSNRRAYALARKARRWDAHQDAWLGEVKPPTEYGQPIRVFVKRRLKEDAFCHSYYLSTLSLPSKVLFMACYDARGGAEVEQFRSDKNGLSSETRRKRSFTGQKGYILLTDLAHNLLADFHAKALVGTRFESYGLKRTVRDLLNFPGRLVFDQRGELVRVELLSLKQFARDLSICLEMACLCVTE